MVVQVQVDPRARTTPPSNENLSFLSFLPSFLSTYPIPNPQTRRMTTVDHEEDKYDAFYGEYWMLSWLYTVFGRKERHITTSITVVYVSGKHKGWRTNHPTNM